MEVQKRVRRFLALHALLLYAATPTAPSGKFSAGGSGAVSVPFSRLGALSRRQLRLAPLDAGNFMLRHPHAFHLFLHPVHRILHARLTPRASAALRLEADAIASLRPGAVLRLRKLLLLAPPHHRLRLEHIRLLRRDFGLPDDFADSIILSNPALFRLTPDGFVEFVPSPDDPPDLTVAAVERSRERHYREHRAPGAGEEDARFAFPTRFPPGFKIGKYFRIAVWKWQRLPYASPYADVSGHDLRSLEAQRRMEKPNLDRMFTSMGRGWDELGGGRRGGAELREKFLGDAGGRKRKVGAGIDDDGADSGEDSGVESLYIE
ncbi:unnamed protein product [Triticum turgidum subsp. durum]|uniref:PORR domain-containing protein n=1 Tax=Triticum turgidum subsp. durum TaxID=4567 RepID=A0A9R1AP07_TRITD|nr:unnamed protein product [Triticum turgidum subsp. durum]